MVVFARASREVLCGCSGGSDSDRRDERSARRLWASGTLHWLSLPFSRPPSGRVSRWSLRAGHRGGRGFPLACCVGRGMVHGVFAGRAQGTAGNSVAARGNHGHVGAHLFSACHRERAGHIRSGRTAVALSLRRFCRRVVPRYTNCPFQKLSPHARAMADRSGVSRVRVITMRNTGACPGVNRMNTLMQEAKWISS